jgi:hypothetical protein
MHVRIATTTKMRAKTIPSDRRAEARQRLFQTSTILSNSMRPDSSVANP